MIVEEVLKDKKEKIKKTLLSHKKYEFYLVNSMNKRRICKREKVGFTKKNNPRVIKKSYKIISSSFDLSFAKFYQFYIIHFINLSIRFIIFAK